MHSLALVPTGLAAEREDALVVLACADGGFDRRRLAIDLRRAGLPDGRVLQEPGSTSTRRR